MGRSRHCRRCCCRCQRWRWRGRGRSAGSANWKRISKFFTPENCFVSRWFWLTRTHRGGCGGRGLRSRWWWSRGTAASASASVSVQRCSTAASAANLLRPGNTFHVAPPLQSTGKRCRPAAAAINQNLISNSDVNSKRQRRSRRRRRRSLPKKLKRLKRKLAKRKCN